MAENQNPDAEYLSSEQEREKVESFMTNQRHSRQVEDFDQTNPHQINEDVSHEHKPTELTETEEDRRGNQESADHQEIGEQASNFHKQDQHHEHPESVIKVEPTQIELSLAEHSTDSNLISIPQEIPHQQSAQPVLSAQSHKQPQLQQSKVNNQSQNYQRIQVQSGERLQAQALQNLQNHKVETVEQTKQVEKPATNEPQQQDPREVEERYQVQTEVTHVDNQHHQEVKQQQGIAEERQHVQTQAQNVPIQNEQIRHEHHQNHQISLQTHVQAQHIEPQHQAQNKHEEIHHEQARPEEPKNIQTHQNQHFPHHQQQIQAPNVPQVQNQPLVVARNNESSPEVAVQRVRRAPQPWQQAASSNEEAVRLVEKPEYQEIEQNNEENDAEKQERQPLVPQNTNDVQLQALPQKSKLGQISQERKKPIKGAEIQKRTGANQHTCKCQIM